VPLSSADLYRARQAVVIATELEDNPGTSVTNMAGPLATQVAQAFGLPLETLVWIEHYPDRGFSAGKPQCPEVFAQVTFTRTRLGLRQPRWQHLPKGQVEALIEQAL
jgi:hypothetical protein